MGDLSPWAARAVGNARGGTPGGAEVDAGLNPTDPDNRATPTNPCPPCPCPAHGCHGQGYGHGCACGHGHGTKHGPGTYDPSPGLSTLGVSGGVGWQAPVGGPLEVEVAGSYFHLFSRGAQDDIDFLLAKAGFKLTF